MNFFKKCTNSNRRRYYEPEILAHSIRHLAAFYDESLGVALLMVYVHSFYKFFFITTEVKYMFAVTAGMVAGLAQQLGYWSRTHAIQFESGDLVRPVANATKNFRIETHS